MIAAPPAAEPALVGVGRVAVAQREVAATLVRWLALLLALVALLLGVLMWQRLDRTQQQLARQSADTQAQAAEARERSLEAQTLVRDTAARLALTDARLREVAQQRAQIEGLVQTLSRSSNDNLVIDLESTLRFAQQQAQLTGSAGPLIAALKSVAQRIDSAAQPRLVDAQRAIARDLDKLTSTQLIDTASLGSRIDDLMRLIEELPLANAAGRLSAQAAFTQDAPPAAEPNGWQRVLQGFAQEARSLLRVARIEHPDAALLSPEQGFFVREHLKLLLQSARLGLFARQFEPARADLAAAGGLIGKYFDLNARKTQFAASQLQQLRVQANATELPRIDESLAALSAQTATPTVR